MIHFFFSSLFLSRSLSCAPHRYIYFASFYIILHAIGVFLDAIKSRAILFNSIFYSIYRLDGLCFWLRLVYDLWFTVSLSFNINVSFYVYTTRGKKKLPKQPVYPDFYRTLASIMRIEYFIALLFWAKFILLGMRHWE